MDTENEKIIEVTKEQMEKVSGGMGLDCFLCPGYIINTKQTQKCSQPLRKVSTIGNVYRCYNGNCELCGDDQYPMGK